MKSLWDVRYVGSHTNIFIKKLQRSLSIDVSEIERERFIADGKKYERATFLVSHNASQWPLLIEEILTIANRITWNWTVLLDMPRTVVGQVHTESPDGCETLLDVPDNLYSLYWGIRSDQIYKRMKLSDKSNEW